MAASNLKDIEDALTELEADIKGSTLSTSKQNEIFERLLNHTRHPGDLSPLLTERGVNICCHYAFSDASQAASRTALRCLCNILFLAESTREILVGGQYLQKAVERMKTDNSDDEFMTARLLLLCTYAKNLDLDTLFDKYQIADPINTNISRHAELVCKTPWGLIPSGTITAFCETLKLLYNLSAKYAKGGASFYPCLEPILKILHQLPIPWPPLQPPLTWLINSLVNLTDNQKTGKPSTGSPIFPSSNENTHIERLVQILRMAAEKHSDEEMDTNGAPLVQVLLQIAESAPAGPKARLRELLLPSAKDREGVLGTGDSLSARLLRLSTAPVANHLRQLIPALLFELSDKDVEKFVHNIGYGFAAGFLQSQGLQPPGGLESRGTSSAQDEEAFEVNPITGQRRDREPNIDLPNMTDEEKEREAERLFVLFERLRATGVVDVENPVAQAAREGRLDQGRIEELDDDSPD